MSRKIKGNADFINDSGLASKQLPVAQIKILRQNFYLGWITLLVSLIEIIQTSALWLFYCALQFAGQMLFSAMVKWPYEQQRQEFFMEHIEIRFGNNLEAYDTEEKSFEEMFQSVNPMFCFSKRVWKPQMDIFETRTEIIIQAEIAGVKKEDIVIDVSNKAVKISGSRKCSQPDVTATYRLAEIQFGQFERVLYLPSVIDVEKVSAVFNNGFLQLTLGKLFVENIKHRHNLSMDFI